MADPGPAFEYAGQDEAGLGLGGHSKMDLNNLHRLKSLAGLDSALPGSGDWTLGASVLPNPEPAPADPKRQICFDFTKHQCTRGAACKFSHDINLIIEVNSQERGICFDFLRNTCSRGPLCRFSHDLSNFTPQDVQHPRNRSSPICYDFVKKQCVRGPECRYSHDLDSIIHGTSLRDAALLARAGLGGLGPVPLASDAALAAAMSGNMPNMSGMGMMPTAAQKYAASAGLIPAYNPAAMSQLAPALNPHLAAALMAQQASLGAMGYLPPMPPPYPSMAAQAQAMYGSRGGAMPYAGSGLPAQGPATAAVWLQQQQMAQQKAQIAMQVEMQQQQVQQQQYQPAAVPSEHMPQASRPLSGWQQHAMQAAAVEGLEEPALSGLSIGAESGAASLPGPTPTADMSAADLASLQHDFTRLGLGPDGQVQPSLGRRATVAGMEGLAQSAGIARHHSDAWPSLHAAQATSQGGSHPDLGDLAGHSLMSSQPQGPPALLHHKSLPASLLAESLSTDASNPSVPGSGVSQLSLCQQIWGRLQ